MVGFSWRADDRIVIGSDNSGLLIDSGLLIVPGGGGEPRPLTTLDEEQGEIGHVQPHVVDGQDVVLFVIRTLSRAGDLALGGALAALDFASGEVSRLGLAGASPRYTSTGHLLFILADGTLQAAPFDIGRLTVTGSPVPMLENVIIKPSGQTNFDISLNGRLVYLTGSGGGLSAPTNLTLVDPDGGRSLLAELGGFAWWPRFSPDGDRIAYAVSEDAGSGGGADLWVLEEHGAQTRVTYGGNNRFYPIWSPDGTRLIHADSPAPTGNRLVSTAADGSSGREVLLDRGARRFPTDWSPDGRTLAYYVGPQGTPHNSRDLWMLFVEGGERARDEDGRSVFQRVRKLDQIDGGGQAEAAPGTGRAPCPWTPVRSRPIFERSPPSVLACLRPQA